MGEPVHAVGNMTLVGKTITHPESIEMAEFVIFAELKHLVPTR